MIARLIRVAAVLVLAAGLGACQLPGAGDPPQLYTLTPKSTFDPSLPAVQWQLVVERPIAPAGINTQRIAFQGTPVTLDYFARANWTDQAPALVQTLLIESFENTGKIGAVSRESTQLRADFILQSELREFQAELNPAGGKMPVAHVRLNGKLIRMPDRTIIGSKTVNRVASATKSDMEGIVLAFDEALGRAMKEIVEWALRAPGTSERPSRN